MRELTSHKVAGLNEAIKIQALDEPGNGGACHCYRITTEELPPPPEVDVHKCHDMLQVVHDIRFQVGPLQEYGPNGISVEALLTIVEDRLLGFQSGEFSCRENAVALTKIQEAMMWLHKRTRDRVARGVEGTSQK